MSSAHLQDMQSILKKINCNLYNYTEQSENKLKKTITLKIRKNKILRNKVIKKVSNIL